MQLKLGAGTEAQQILQDLDEAMDQQQIALPEDLHELTALRLQKAHLHKALGDGAAFIEELQPLVVDALEEGEAVVAGYLAADEVRGGRGGGELGIVTL